MRSYETARGLFSFLAFCAWSIVVIGALVALIGAGGGSRYGGAGAGLIAMAPGIGIGISGLILVAFVQMGRANVDTAEYSQQMLKVARDQLDVSRQGLKQGAEFASGFSALKQEVPSSTEAAAAQTATLANFEVQVPGKNDAMASSSEQVTHDKAAPGPVLDENGFTLLESDGSLLEYRGRQVSFENGVYDLAGQKFATPKSLKKYMNQLKVLEPKAKAAAPRTVV